MRGESHGVKSQFVYRLEDYEYSLQGFALCFPDVGSRRQEHEVKITQAIPQTTQDPLSPREAICFEINALTFSR